MDSILKEKVLSQVQGPSRCLGSEVNSVHKTHDPDVLKVVLAFPDLYEIGTSHFGIQILYHILNQQDGVLAERVYAPPDDLERLLAHEQAELFALESGKPLKEFDWIGFSLLYELNYTNVLTMLHSAGIPFLSKDRGPEHPLIVGGGPCTCNPEPVADFFDAILVGDGEEAVVRMVQAWKSWKAGGNPTKEGLLESLSRINGIYVPKFYSYSPEEGVKPDREGAPFPVRRAVVANLDEAPFPCDPIVPYSRPVHDRLRLEISRGCSRGCRFCQAGMIYRPVRERSAVSLCEMARNSLDSTGYEDASLLSLSVGDYSRIDWLMGRFMREFAPEHVSVSFPSVRAGTLTKPLMEEIKKVRKTGFTIAPEAGSQRLRDVINKNITEEEIVQTVSDAFFMGWKLIKLYFMIGLPTETHEDVQAIVDLVHKLKKIAGRKADITASVGVFTPKPHTPFQWVRQISVQEAWERIDFIKDRLRRPGIKVKWQNPQVSLVEGIFSRGDRRLSSLLVHAWTQGARFDGWTDHFDFPLWRKAMEEVGVNPEDYTDAKDMDAPLPWDHIDAGVKRDFFAAEWSKAQKQEKTEACGPKSCAGCGVCDFKTLQPVWSPPPPSQSYGEAPVETDQAVHRKLQVVYSKTGPARHLGHLEMVSQVHRALRRARTPMLYSKGFHPKPKVSFGQALPVGMESLEEDFVVTVESGLQPSQLEERLARELPEGLEVVRCQPFSKGARIGASPWERYEVHPGSRHAQAVKAFGNHETFVVTHRNHKGNEWEIDLAEMVRIEEVNGDRAIMAVKNTPGKSLRPLEILSHILGVSSEELAGSRVVKLPAAPPGV